jgi:hypothetical protein
VRVVYLPGKPLRALDLNDLKRLWKDSREHTAGECAHEVKSLSPNDSLLDLAHALWDVEWGELPVMDGEKIAVPKAFQGQPLRQLHLRERFGVVALALRKTCSPHVEEIAPGQVLESGDRLLVLGTPVAIDRLRSGIA